MTIQKNHLKGDIAKLRILLILLTITQLGYLVVMFIDTKLWLKIDEAYYANWIVWGFHYSAVGFVVWFIWKRMPIEKKTKINQTLMILILGIIGMWLWLPNERELNQLKGPN